MSGAALLPVGDFGPFDRLSDYAYSAYLVGDFAAAVDVCRGALEVARMARDTRTEWFLIYIAGISQAELGRHADVAAGAQLLLAEMDAETAPAWRAKALALLAESCVPLGETSRAMDALAEGAFLLGRAEPDRYTTTSAKMAVALAMRALDLFEQADELLHSALDGQPRGLAVLVHQERILNSITWAATLELVGETAAAEHHHVQAVQRCLLLESIADPEEDCEAALSAGICQAYVWERLGHPELATRTVQQAQARDEQRDATIGGLLRDMVLGRAATAAGEFERARVLLDAAAERAHRVGRSTWAATALAALADLDEAELGAHPAVARWRSVARDLLVRTWRDREARFSALRARIRIRELMEETDRMGQAVLEDPLTGLGNRRQLAQHLAASAEGELSVVFIDVDEFKQINDRHSHETGDLVLQEIATLLRRHCRPQDVVVRYGGDEFLVVTATEVGTASQIAERILVAVREHPGWVALHPGLSVTVSIGLAASLTGAQAMEAADSALYTAKRSGRDQLVVF